MTNSVKKREDKAGVEKDNVLSQATRVTSSIETGTANDNESLEID
jgi:hypothetical protein